MQEPGQKVFARDVFTCTFHPDPFSHFTFPHWPCSVIQGLAKSGAPEPSVKKKFEQIQVSECFRSDKTSDVEPVEPQANGSPTTLLFRFSNAASSCDATCPESSCFCLAETC